MKSEPILWRIYRPRPGEFLCLLCKKRDATLLAHIDIGGTRLLNLPVCEICAGKSEAEVWELLKDKTRTE